MGWSWGAVKGPRIKRYLQIFCGEIKVLSHSVFSPVSVQLVLALVALRWVGSSEGHKHELQRFADTRTGVEGETQFFKKIISDIKLTSNFFLFKLSFYKQYANPCSLTEVAKERKFSRRPARLPPVEPLARVVSRAPVWLAGRWQRRDQVCPSQMSRLVRKAQ